MPEESEEAPLPAGSFALAFSPLASGLDSSPDDDVSVSLESSLLLGELASLDSGNFATGLFDKSESSEIDEETFVDVLVTLVFLAGRPPSDESELESDDSDELDSAFRFKLFVATILAFCFSELVVDVDLELLSLSSSASLSEEEDEDEDEDEDEEDEDEDEDDDDEAARFAAGFLDTFAFRFFVAARSDSDESSVLLSLLLELLESLVACAAPVVGEAPLTFP